MSKYIRKHAAMTKAVSDHIMQPPQHDANKNKLPKAGKAQPLPKEGGMNYTPRGQAGHKVR